MSTEEQLGRTFREQAEGIDDRPLTLGDVRGRARRIRRRQASGVVAGFALVAAVALPVALLGGAGGDRSEPSPAPSPTQAVDPNDRAVPTLQDGVIVYQDGPRIPLTGDLRDTADAFAVLGTDRYVVLATTPEGDREATLIDEVGQPLDRFPLGDGGITAGPDGTSVAWIAPDRTLHLLVAGSDEPRTIELSYVRPTQTAAIGGDCADQCTIAVRTARSGEVGGTVLVTSDRVIDGPAAVPAVTAISPDGSLIAGFDSVADDDIHLCGGMYDVGVGDYVWEGCDDNIFQFSPDGALVATSFAEGLGPTGVRIRDARSGATLAEVTGSWIASSAWEDPTHLLAVVVEDDGSTSLQRIGVDGPPETVLDGFTTGGEEPWPPIALPLG